MAELMTAKARLMEGMRFMAESGSGHIVNLDASVEHGGADLGFRPMELLLVGLAGCTAMDVISILRKKRQLVTGYEIRVTGLQREETPHAFIRFDVVHVLDGDLDVDAVRRAIDLSSRKYCSVGSTLASGSAELHHGYLIRRPDGGEEVGEVLVTGPFASFEEQLAGT